MLGPSAAPAEAWWRKCRLIAIHDGDTCTLEIELGFDVWTTKPLRLYGVNAPELKVADGSGRAALVFSDDWLHAHAAHGTFLVRYVSWDKYAPRFDGVLVCAQGHCLNDALLESGNAVPMQR